MTGVENLLIYFPGGHNLGQRRQFQQIYCQGKPPGWISPRKLDRVYISLRYTHSLKNISAGIWLLVWGEPTIFPYRYFCFFKSWRYFSEIFKKIIIHGYRILRENISSLLPSNLGQYVPHRQNHCISMNIDVGVL